MAVTKDRIVKKDWFHIDRSTTVILSYSLTGAQNAGFIARIPPDRLDR
jgi:hypothetical protein